MLSPSSSSSSAVLLEELGTKVSSQSFTTSNGLSENSIVTSLEGADSPNMGELQDLHMQIFQVTLSTFTCFKPRIGFGLKRFRPCNISRYCQSQIELVVVANVIDLEAQIGGHQF